jgi:hypothetical protein
VQLRALLASAKTPVFEIGQKTPVLHILDGSVVRVSEHIMQIAAYVRVSTDDQNEQRQMRAIREKYDEQGNQIKWYCDLGESGASPSRRE